MARIGFLGDGQLARMSAMAAITLGHQVIFFGKDPAGPCAHLGEFVFGDHQDFAHLARFLAQVDVVTLENEFYPPSVLQQINQQTALLPTAASFARVENKWDQRCKCQAFGVQIALSLRVRDHAYQDLQQQLGRVFLVKANKGGYDGYGNLLVQSAADFQRAQALFGADNLVAEQLLDLESEYAITVVRNRAGEMVSYPVVETVQVEQKCARVVFSEQIPAPIGQVIRKAALHLMSELALVGVCSFEFFYTKAGEIIFNELAPRPHNSAHYTMDACAYSQFQNHILAITDASLGPTTPLYPTAVMLNLLGTQNGPAQLQLPAHIARRREVRLHLYQKENSRIGRKMGHINLVGPSLSPLLELAQIIEREVGI